MEKICQEIIVNGNDPCATWSKSDVLNQLDKHTKNYHQYVEKSNEEWASNPKDLVKVNNVKEIQELILRAKNENKKIRVAGSQHSPVKAIFGDPNENVIRVKLESDLRKVEKLENKEFDNENTDTDSNIGIFRVGCGCNLGIDPSDPNSNEENSFNRIIEKEGFALSITGGITHQTIAGFMMTNSSGGTIKYSFHDSLLRIEWVDGNGQIRIANKGDDNFYAVGISCGLYGVITHVVVKLQKTYLVKGVEETVEFDKSFICDSETYSETFDKNEYVHGVWFPQQGVNRVLQFVGNQTAVTDAIIPYEHLLQKKYMNYLAALVLYVHNTFDNTDSIILQKIATWLLKLMTPLEKEIFCDYWYIALPVDDQVLNDTVMKVQFTEIWIDFDKVDQVLMALQKLFDDDANAGGNLGFEIYAGKGSDFWMSPSFGRNSIRINPYWWKYNPKGNMNDFFAKFWDVLLPIEGARLHWGKHFPEVGTEYKHFTIGVDYVAKSYPKYEEFMKLRETFDPHQLFVTKYWKEMFGIQ
eukprot:425373_1